MSDNSRKYNTKKITDFYEDNIKKHKNGIKILGWGSGQTQEKRFEILSQIADLNGNRILDVGCGLGDFYRWLKGRFHDFQYTGIDLVPSLINMASQNYPEASFKVQTVDKDGRGKVVYDYVFASGIFNRKIRKHEVFVRDTIIKMFALSKKGIGFNVLSTKADFKEKEEYYADPIKLLAFCFKLSRKVVMRHDYMTHDFTIYVYKA